MKTKVKRFWKKRYFGQAIVFALFLSFGVVSIMQSDAAYAEAHQSTITLGANIDTLSINLRPSVSGSFDKSADCIINVRTDNFTGYTLSIASASQDPDHATSLTDGNGNYIESITSNVSEADFKNSANTQYNNKWGYKPSQYIQSGTVIPNENYLPSPSLNGNLLDITSAANTVDNTYTITLGARIDSNIPAGAYSNDFIVYAIANDIVYNINYNKNTEDNVTNMPSPNPQVVTIEGGTSAAESYATLSNNTPTRTGYTFAGWCDSATTLDPNTGNQVCSTTTYQPNTDYGIDQTAGPNVVLYAIWNLNTYNITIGTSTGISSINVTKDSTNICTASGPTATVCQLKYNMTYNIVATPNTGFSFNEWQNSTSRGSFGDVTQATTTFTPGIGDTTLTATATANTYTVTLNNNGGSGGSSSTSVTYGATTLGTITNPTKANTTGTRTISGFSAGTGATDATIEYNSTQPSGSTCSAANNCKSTNSTSYTFNGWHDTSGTGTLVASSATTPALQANVSGYTNSSKQWTRTSDATLYAGWDSSAGSYSSVTLPTIKKTGYTCHWNTNSSDTGTTYASGASVTPGSNLTLTGFCSVNKYNLVITGDSNVSAMSVKEGSTSGTSTSCTKSGTNFTCSSLTYGTKYYLYPSFASGYEFSSWTKTDSASGSSLGSTTTENTYYQMGAGAGAVTLASKGSVPGYCTDVATCMQTMTSSDCTTVAKTVVDSRDGQQYKVQKLADNKCWLLDNLRLDLTNSTVLNSLTTSNTNADSASLTSLKSGNRTAGSQYATSGFETWNSSSTSNSFSVAKANADYKDTVASVTYGDGSGKIGLYYNYCAATAGAFCYGSGTSYGTAPATNVQYDLCPSGWRLPIGGDENSQSEYIKLAKKYDTNSSPDSWGRLYGNDGLNYKNAFSAMLSGGFYSGNPFDQGTNGNFWSATSADNNSQAFGVSIKNDSSSPMIYSINQSNRNFGRPIRCVYND